MNAYTYDIEEGCIEAVVNNRQYVLKPEEIIELEPMNREQRRHWLENHPDIKQRRDWRS